MGLVIEVKRIGDELVDIDFGRAFKTAAVSALAAISTFAPAAFAARTAAFAPLSTVASAFSAPAAFTAAAPAFARPVFTFRLLLFLRFRHVYLVYRNGRLQTGSP
jgi:hypothetical protein